MPLLTFNEWIWCIIQLQTLIEHGAMTLVVPGSLPLGCFATILTIGMSPNEEDYDPATGCLKGWNEFNRYHNEFLVKELDRLRHLHPHATIIYGDYYNTALQVFLSPPLFGVRFALHSSHLYDVKCTSSSSALGSIIISLDLHFFFTCGTHTCVVWISNLAN